MATTKRRDWNPLDLLPTPDAVRARLTEAERLAAQLRVLLEVTERVRNADPGGPCRPVPPAAA